MNPAPWHPRFLAHSHRFRGPQSTGTAVPKGLLTSPCKQSPRYRLPSPDISPPSPNLTRAAPQCCKHPHPEFIHPTATARPPQHTSISLRVLHELLLTQLPLLSGAGPSTSILNLFFFVRLHSGTSLVPANALQSILKALHPKGTFYKVPELGNLATSLHLPEHCSPLEPGLSTDKSFCSGSFPQIFSSPEAAPNTQTAAFLPLMRFPGLKHPSKSPLDSSHNIKLFTLCIFTSFQHERTCD